MDPRHKGPSPLALEQWLLNEQTEAERADTEARLDAGARVRLRSDDAALRVQLFARLPPERFAARVRGRALVQGGTLLPRWAWGMMIASAAALLVVARLEVPVPDEPSAATERVKGDELELRLYRSREGTPERFVDGALAGEHDVVQLAIKRSGHAFGVLLSVDGRGAVTLHYPSDRLGSTALPRENGELLLPNAYELDDAPAFERFILVAADEPLSVDVVLAAARVLARDPAHARGDPLLLPMRSSQRSLLIMKPEPR